MSAQLESDLRAALAERGARLPADASAEVLARVYPVRSPLPRPALAVAVVALLACAALVVSSIGVDRGPSRAFAGWSAIPTRPSVGQVAEADRVCRSRLPTSAGIERAQRTAKEDDKRPWPMPNIGAGGWRTVLVDARGPYTTILYAAAGGRAQMDCLADRHSDSASLGGGYGLQAPAPIPAGRARVLSWGFTRTSPQEGDRSFSRLMGRTGPGVETVHVVLADGRRLKATRADGWFLAWWPGQAAVRSIEVAGAHGTHRRPLEDPLRAHRR